MGAKKYYYSPKVKCPLYRGEMPQLIRCGEVTAGDWKVFSDRAEWSAHKDVYCHKDYQNCPVYITMIHFNKLSPANKQMILDIIKRME